MYVSVNGVKGVLTMMKGSSDKTKSCGDWEKEEILFSWGGGSESPSRWRGRFSLEMGR